MNPIANLNQEAHSPYQRYFWLFILLHSLAWTLGPALLRPSLPHDVLEGISWGLQWQWGYSKHPFLTAWLCAGVTQLFGHTGWPVYALAQLAVLITFLAVWQLAKQMLKPLPALIATLSLEGVLFYNINSFNLTPDSLQSPIWALLCLFFYQALDREKLKDWLLTGFMAGLAILTKYQAALIFLPMLGFCLAQSRVRQQFLSPKPYLALGVFLLLIMPHLVWLADHHFMTVYYAFNTPNEYTLNHSCKAHFSNSLGFIANSLANILAVLVLLWPFWKKPQCRFLKPFDRQFIYFMGLGPWMLTLILCLISGDHFPPRWTTPYFFLIGIISLDALSPSLEARPVRQYALSLILLSLALFSGRMASFTLFPRAHSDAFLPNQIMAQRLETLWYRQYHTPLPYLAGSHYLVAVLLPYFEHSPSPFFNWDLKESSWISLDALKTRGGLFIWDKQQNYAWDASSRAMNYLPPAILMAYPNLKFLPDLRFHRLGPKKEELTIGVALLPPQ